MGKIEKLMNTFDLFKSSIELNINGRSQVPSIIGVVLSIFLSAFTIFLVVYNLYDWAVNNTPNVNFQTLFGNVLTLDNVSISEFNSIIFIGQQPSMSPANFKISSSSINSFHYKIQNDTNSTDFENIGSIVKCDEYMKLKNTKGSILWEMSHKKFAKILYSMECPIFNFPWITLGGAYIQIDEEKFINGELNYEMCDGSDEGCVKDNKLMIIDPNKPFMFFYNFENREPDMFNRSHGYRDIIDSHTFQLNLNKNILLSISLVKTTISSDNNWIFKFNDNDVKTFYRYKVSSKEIEKEENQMKNHLQIKIAITVDPSENFYERDYRKLDSLLADIGAMYSLAFNILSAIHGFLTSNYIEFHMMKQIYNFTNYSKNKEYSNDFFSEEENKVKIYNIESNLPDNKNNYVEDKDLKIFKISENLTNLRKKYEKRKIKIERSKYLMNIIVCCKTKMKNSEYYNILESGTGILEFDLNLVQIIQKLTEYEQLKKILLSKTQIKFLKVISKRRITPDTDFEAYLRKIKDNNYTNNDFPINIEDYNKFQEENNNISDKLLYYLNSP